MVGAKGQGDRKKGEEKQERGKRAERRPDRGTRRELGTKGLLGEHSMLAAALRAETLRHGAGIQSPQLPASATSRGSYRVRESEDRFPLVDS